MTDLSSCRICRVETSGKYFNVDPEILKRVIGKRIRRYLIARNDQILECDLRIAVVECAVVGMTGEADLKARVEGCVNGKSIRKTFRCRRGRSSASNGVGMAMVAAMATMIAASNAASNKGQVSPFGNGAAGFQLVDCIEDFASSLELIIDGHLRISESSTGVLWQRIQWVCWILPAILVGLNLAAMAVHGKKDLNLGFVSGIMFYASMWIVLHALGYMVMPESFYLYDARGRRALARSGIRSILATRILAFILFVICLAASYAFFLLSWADSKDPNRVKYRDGEGEVPPFSQEIHDVQSR